jgi:hypothetical protein
MRRFDKKKNVQKANLLSEQRHLESKDLIKENSFDGYEPEAFNVMLENTLGVLLGKIKDEMNSIDQDSGNMLDKWNRLEAIREFISRALQHAESYTSEIDDGDFREDFYDEPMNEILGFGSSIGKITKKYASAIENIKLDNKELDWDYANEAMAKLKEFNNIVDAMLADNNLMKYLVKNDTASQLEKVKRNIGVDKYGRNRPDGLYLGDTQGLNTLKIDDWIRKGDYDSKNIITRQLSSWINSNADALLKLISQDKY